MKGRPDDWTAVVRGNWAKMTAYVVSSHDPSCIRMAKDEVEHIDRVMVHVPLDGIQGLATPKHWFMAVIVCPADNLAGLAAWARSQDAQRVHFYLHKDAEPHLLAPWRDAGHPLSRVEAERFAHFGRLHAKLGLDRSDQVYGDFGP